MNVPRPPEDRIASPVIVAATLSNSGYTNPGNAVDGNQATFASSVSATASCTWSFTGGVKSVSRLFILSEVLGASGSGATIQYSTDNGVTFTTLYTSNARTLQWNEVNLPTNQDLNQLQVKATNVTGSTHDVYEICVVVGTAADKYKFKLTDRRPEFDGNQTSFAAPLSGQIFPTGRS